MFRKLKKNIDNYCKNLINVQYSLSKNSIEDISNIMKKYMDLNNSNNQENILKTAIENFDNYYICNNDESLLFNNYYKIIVILMMEVIMKMNITMKMMKIEKKKIEKKMKKKK